MTRTTAEIMEWRDPVLVAQIEAYATGYLWARNRPDACPPPNKSQAYLQGVTDALRVSVDLAITQPHKAR